MDLHKAKHWWFARFIDEDGFGSVKEFSCKEDALNFLHAICDNRSISHDKIELEEGQCFHELCLDLRAPGWEFR